MTDRTAIDPDFAELPDAIRAEIEGAQGVGLHHAPDAPAAGIDDPAFGDAETDGAETPWSPEWEPIDTCPGGVVMLNDGARQVLARRENGVWSELVAGEARPLGDYAPMLWSRVPDRVNAGM